MFVLFKLLLALPLTSLHICYTSLTSILMNSNTRMSDMSDTRSANPTLYSIQFEMLLFTLLPQITVTCNCLSISYVECSN